MEVDSKRTLHAVSFAIVMVLLMLLCAGLVAMVAITARGAREADGATRQYFYRMAWLSLAMLGLSVVVLVWVVIHRVFGRLGRGSPRQPTTHVDAWALAGQRFKLDDEPKDSEPQEPEP